MLLLSTICVSFSEGLTVEEGLAVKEGLVEGEEGLVEDEESRAEIRILRRSLPLPCQERFQPLPRRRQLPIKLQVRVFCNKRTKVKVM